MGLELNPRAAAIADVVLKIGYLQWHLRTHGVSELPEPLLDEYENIQQQDAVLKHGPPVPRLDANGQPVTRWDGVTTKLHPATGQPVPDETARTLGLDYPNPKPAEWPKADFIVGNPPFVGMKRMRLVLGDGYTEALREVYSKYVPDSADFVMYWWYKAAEAVQKGSTKRFGFITTNSITQIFNRRIIESYLESSDNPLSITFAIPNHPWINGVDGAAVRIAATIVEAGKSSGVVLNVVKEAKSDEDGAFDVETAEIIGIINSDLSAGADTTTAHSLKSNDGLSYLGVKLYGSGFILSPDEANSLKQTTSQAIIRPYISGQDLTQKLRGLSIIDTDSLSLEQMISNYPDALQRLSLYVKPEREQNPSKEKRERWWLFGVNQTSMRKSVRGLMRYIVTTETTKHRFFQFVPGTWLAEGKVIAIAFDDAYYLGVLSSRIHVVWALITGGILGVGNTPVYNKSRCFDPFPFPNATLQQRTHIRELAEQLDAHRKRQQAIYPTLTLTDLYNVVEKLRTGETFTDKEQAINQYGLASVVLSLHQQIDVAVADAYGWPHDLPNSELLNRLVRLNHERAAEEATGYIRYLRPSYQAPGQQQLGIDLQTTTPATSTQVSITSQQEWPKELAQQMQAVRDAVQQAGVPLSTKQVAAFFQRIRPEKVQPLLDTLAALALVRQTSEGSYAM